MSEVVGRAGAWLHHAFCAVSIHFPLLDVSVFLRCSGGVLCTRSVQIEEGQSASGNRTLRQAFTSDSDIPSSLHAGDGGTVLQVDEDGDALIRFDDHEQPQWVFSAHYSHLEGARSIHARTAAAVQECHEVDVVACTACQANVSKIARGSIQR